MVLTDKQLAELERLNREATPGPWSWENDLTELVSADGTPVLEADAQSVHPLRDDAAFIAAARNALPELVAEVRRLRAALRASEDEIDRTRMAVLDARVRSRREGAAEMRARAALLAEQAVIGIDPHDGMSRLVDGIRAMPLPGDE